MERRGARRAGWLITIFGLLLQIHVRELFSCTCIDSDCVEIWFPAAGGRNNSTGAVYNASTNGNYWSSSPYDTGTNGGYLNFNKDGGVNPRNNTNRANGLSVRCVSEFRRLFLMFCFSMFMFYL